MSDAPSPATGLAALLWRRLHRRRPPRPVSLFEFWPSGLFYLPVALQWIGLGLRHRGLGTLTAANPRITAGGLCGESKSEVLDQVGPTARGWIAPYLTFPLGPAADAGEAVRAEARLAAAGLSYPVIAKPDLGCNGAGVRVLRDGAALARYLAEFPRGQTVVLQRFVPDPGEAGLFYVRRPDETRGRITSITLKFSPEVVGDGRSSLRTLVLADPRARLVPHFYLPRLGEAQHRVPAAGERVALSFVGNHCRGSIFRNGADLITPALTETLDAIARAIPEFHFGRFDVRYRSAAELRRGQGFTIIEINGAGSEATHIWDAETSLVDAYAAQFAHYRLAFEIGAANRARGFRPTPIWRVFRLWREHKRLMARYPAND
ncbi:MAG: D-alanine--D-alanine ligase [Acetobacteraceae bacterium]